MSYGTSRVISLNESPSEKEGKSPLYAYTRADLAASMKVPPKRKGNTKRVERFSPVAWCLNESPSEKEGKFRVTNVETGESFSLNESPSEKEGK